MKIYNRILSVFVLLALFSFSALQVAWSQDDREYDPQRDSQIADSTPPPAESSQPADPSQPDPPTRAARLQYMTGSVSVQPHGTDDWVAGQLNRPLTNADNIWADKNSRAEINVGTALIRIDSESSLTLSNVDENSVQLQLHQGAMNLHVRRLYDGEIYEVDTPNQAFTVQKPGDYRFDVDPNSDKTVITVWRGQGESTGSGPAVELRENEQVRFTNGNSLQHDIHAAPGLDGFDQWARSRDGRFEHSASARYVSPDVVGYEDLDEYGSWRDVPTYGHVWVPSGVGAGWAPYRDGHWVWISPWGWTWVEDEPWGYAPFHYGRWVYYDDYWAWAPGPVYVRPYYAPALVAWFGGPGWGVSFGFGGGYGYGWCPLGFGEPFVPWYGVSRGYFNRVNVTNTRITNITTINNIYNNTYVNNTYNNRPGKPGPGKPPGGGGGGGPYGPHSGHQIRYANMRAPNGFTAVSRDTLLNSRNVARNAVRVSPNQLSRVSAVRAVDARPTRTTMLGANAGRGAAMPPPRTFSRPVVSRAVSPAGNRGVARAASPIPGAARNDRPSPQIANVRPNNARPNDIHPNPVRPNVASPNNGERQNVGVNAQHPGQGMSNRPVPNAGSMNRNQQGDVSAQRGSFPARAVPRPPSAGGFGESQSAIRSAPGNVRADQRPMNSPAMSSRPQNNSGISRPDMSKPDTSRPTVSGSAARPSGTAISRNNVPHPPSASLEGGSGRPSGNMPSSESPRSTVPAPRSVEVPRGSSPSPRSVEPPHANNGGFSGDTTPRPSYGHGSSPYDRGSSRPAPSYSRPAPNYGGSYGRSVPNYGGGSYSRPAPAPSYGGGSYSRSMPSYGGGGYGNAGRAPSYGGGGGRPSGGGGFGGGHTSGGFGSGGGHASAPSHNSGGGGSHNNGEGHQGHH